MNSREIAKDPLTHFILAGLILYVILAAAKPQERPAPIVADDANLLRFIQYRSKAFDEETARQLSAAFTPEERARIARDFVREEALYREAKALNLDADDYVIRQRLVQKTEFLAEAMATWEPANESDARAWYDAHASEYQTPAAATLTHVYFSTQSRTAEEAIRLARAALAQLNAKGAGFNDAGDIGDRFVFHRNYVDRTDDYIRSQLGDAVGDAVFGGAAPGVWRGPFLSEYGAHLIFVARVTPAATPPFADVAEAARADASEARRQAAIDKAIGDIVAKYPVEAAAP
jgi:hypothetical protein